MEKRPGPQPLGPATSGGAAGEEWGGPASCHMESQEPREDDMSRRKEDSSAWGP